MIHISAPRVSAFSFYRGSNNCALLPYASARGRSVWLNENVKLVCFNGSASYVSVVRVRIHATLMITGPQSESYESQHCLVGAADRGSERNDNGFLVTRLAARGVI